MFQFGTVGNELENIGRNLLTGLNQIEVANFGHNPCVDFKYTYAHIFIIFFIQFSKQEIIISINKNLIYLFTDLI